MAQGVRSRTQGLKSTGSWILAFKDLSSRVPAFYVSVKRILGYRPARLGFRKHKTAGRPQVLNHRS